MTSQERLYAIVHGHVQGVSFRYYTMQEANRLNVVGWVRNRTDRTVEVLAEGTRPALEAFYEFLQRGSPAAQVAQVDVEWRAATGEYSDFEIIR
jgi:acylphosphatase